MKTIIIIVISSIIFTVFMILLSIFLRNKRKKLKELYRLLDKDKLLKKQKSFKDLTFYINLVRYFGLIPITVIIFILASAKNYIFNIIMYSITGLFALLIVTSSFITPHLIELENIINSIVKEK